MTKKAQPKQIAFLGLFTLVMILLMGEITARIFIKPNILPELPEKETVDPYSFNPYLMGMRPYTHFFIPGAKYTQTRSSYAVEYRINSMGFRGNEIPPKKKDTRRLIVIGDSVVEGAGCDFDKTFPRLLNEKAHALNWEVLNLGIQGASPVYFAANTERYFSTKPDAAVIVMFENDLFDDRFQEQCYFKMPFMDDPEILINGEKSSSSFMEGSRLYVLLKRSFKELYRNPLEKTLVQNSRVEINSSEQKELAKTSPLLITPSMKEKQWSMSRKYLDIVKSEFTKRKTPLYVVFLSLGALHPTREKAFHDHVEMMNSRIKAWAEETDTPFLSLIPAVKKLHKTLPTPEIMIVDDGHPTPRLHGIIADILWKWFTEGKQP